MINRNKLTKSLCFLLTALMCVNAVPSRTFAATQYAYKVRTAQYEYSDNTMTYIRYGKYDLDKRKNLSFSMDIYVPKAVLEQKPFYLNLNFDVTNIGNPATQLIAAETDTSSYLGIYKDNGKYRARLGSIDSGKSNKLKLTTTKNFIVVNMSKIKLYDTENIIASNTHPLEISPYFSLLTYEAIDFYVDNLTIYSGSTKLNENTSNIFSDTLWYQHGKDSSDGTSQASPHYSLQSTKIDTLKLKKSSGTIGVGKTVKINATDSLGGKITYTSKNKKIATVDKKGTVKGVKKGKTVIQVSVNGMTEKFTILVK